MLMTIIAVIIVLGGLIFFHELGHFAVARCLGMGVSTFSLGFGPKILKHKMGKTEYALSLVPLGGYVALVGESNESEIPEGFSPKESFALRPAWQRLLVVAAGPAAKAGLKAGDRILSIDGRAVGSWDAMSEAIAHSGGKPMQLEVLRPAPGAAMETAPAADGTRGQVTTAEGETLHLEMTAERAARKTIFGENETAWLIGVRAANSVDMQPKSFWEAASAGATETGRMVSLTWLSFVKLAERVVPLDQVGGPIMIAQMVGKQVHEGLPGLLALTALISINLGILNLLPIPILDGGQVVFCLLEIIFRRPVNRRVQEYAMRAGLALLIALMLLATFNDVWRLIKSAGGAG